MTKKKFLRKLLKKLKWSILFFILALAGLSWKYFNDIEILKKSYRNEKSKEIQEIAGELSTKINYMYQTIRTMSLVPSVRAIDSNAANLGNDAKATLQQLYNNAYLNIKLSEVYILPRSMDPDKIDPATGKNEEPITTFDEFNPNIFLNEEASASNEESKPEFEEVEIEEYRLMKTQLEFLASQFPSSSSIKGLDLPMISGKDVVTCDNSEFTKDDFEKKNDEPRKGVVFTVPRYGIDGKFKGAISAVIRNNVLRSFLPDNNFALVNKSHGFSSILNPSDSLKDSIQYFNKDELNPNLIVSKVVKIDIKDSAPWEVWAALSNDLFWQSTEAREAKKLYIIELSMALIFFILLVLKTNKDLRVETEINQIIENLGTQIGHLTDRAVNLKEASTESAESAENQSAAAHETAASMEEISGMVIKTTDTTKDLTKLGENSLSASNNGKKALEKVLGHINNISDKQSEIQNQLKENEKNLSRVIDFIGEIGTKVQLINEIVFQTKLLSFNASVEAARAGEHGKGFSVVAEEIGNLAQVSGNSASEIMKALEKGTSEVNDILRTSNTVFKDILDSSARLSEESVQSAKDCSEVFDEIYRIINEMSSQINEIALAGEEQKKGIEESSKSFHTINDGIRVSGNQAKNVLDISVALSDQADELKSLLIKLNSLSSKNKQTA